jgi:hypothetical protein
MRKNRRERKVGRAEEKQNEAVFHLQFQRNENEAK